MKRSILLLMALVILGSYGVAVAQNPVDDVASKKQTMHMYQVVMAERGPNWVSQNSENGMDIRMEVIAAVKKAAAQGLIVSAGLVNDETDVEFILIFDVETKTEAYNLLHNAKHVKNGHFTPMIYSWFAPEGVVFQE